jgi:hypothetical protein
MLIERKQLADGKSVAKSAAANTIDFDMGGFRKFSVLVIPDATHSYGVKANWASDICEGDGKVQTEVIASASQGNIVSAIFESKSDIVSLEIANGDGSDPHTYDVYIFRMV